MRRLWILWQAAFWRARDQLTYKIRNSCRPLVRLLRWWKAPLQGLYLHRTHKTIALPGEIISELIPVVHSVTLFSAFNRTGQFNAVLKTAVPQEPDESSTPNFIYILLFTFKRSHPSVSLSVRKTIAKRNPYFRRICPFVRSYGTNNSAPTGRIFVKFYISGASKKICLQVPVFIKIRQKTHTWREDLRTFTYLAIIGYCNWYKCGL
jgi:hypothetical protein